MLHCASIKLGPVPAGGGGGGLVFGGVHRLDLGSQEWTEIKSAGEGANVPAPRYSHVAVPVVPRAGTAAESVLMLGGFDAASNSSTTCALVRCSSDRCDWTGRMQLQPADPAHPTTELLLVRHAAAQLWPGGPVVCVGGGAGCFSFGTLTNSAVITVRVGCAAAAAHPALQWGALSGGAAAPGTQAPTAAAALGGAAAHSRTRRPVRRCDAELLPTADAFLAEVVQRREPVVIAGSYGSATAARWDWAWMAALGSGAHGSAEEVAVSVHALPAAAGKRLSFTPRNFQFESMSWTVLCNRVAGPGAGASGSCNYYLRSVGLNPRKDVSHVREALPALVEQVPLPAWLAPLLPGYADAAAEDSRYFSSCVRVGSPGLELWTHYDMMDNVLLQLAGTKRVVLWPPTAADRMYMDGSTSTVVDVDAPDRSKFPLFPAPAEAVEVVLQPGDALFIPALWLHHVKSVTAAATVNVFWRHLPASHYAEKDLYGNRDLPQAEAAAELVDRALQKLAELPPEYRAFYKAKLVGQIGAAAAAAGGEAPPR
eukprot:SAG22_NODE_139_length_18025_cov_4.352058_7_plen_540_part_00